MTELVPKIFGEMAFNVLKYPFNSRNDDILLQIIRDWYDINHLVAHKCKFMRFDDGRIPCERALLFMNGKGVIMVYLGGGCLLEYLS